ncbi:MAG: hypothetical protein QXL24_00595, partial [Candidatus Jordarchaeaceae archaeon]
MRNKIKIIVLDLDGTLIDVPDGDLFDRLLVESLEEIGGRLPSRKQRDLLWESGKDYQKILRSWGIKDIDNFWRVFDRRDFETRLRLIKSNKIRPYDDVAVLEDLCREYALGVVTNTPLNLALMEMDTFGLTHY